MPHPSHLTPVHAISVPDEMRGTRRAIFFLLRCIQAGPQAVLAPRPPRAAHPAPQMDTDTFVFQF